MGSIGEVIRYLRGCYEADNREASIFNLRSDRVEHLEFLSKGGDFVRGLLDVVPVERTKALEAQKAAELYKTERSLVFGSVLLTGSVEGPRGKTAMFAPMLYYPARVEDLGEFAVLRVDWQQQRVNTRLLQAMIGDGEQALDTLLGKIPSAPFQPTDVYDLIAVLEELAPGIDTSHLREFGNAEAVLRVAPAAADESVAEGKGAPAAWWGHVMALIPNSPETRGVLTEMAEMTEAAGAEQYSAPIRAVFGEKVSGITRGKERRYTLPALLSPAQEKAVWSAATNTLTVLHGPPGTGKSYTCAALALDHVARGKSVLIAARTDQALDVILEKLERLLGDTRFVLRGGRTGQFAELKQRLDDLLSRATQLDMQNAALSKSELRQRVSLRWAAIGLARTERRVAERLHQERAWATADETLWGNARRRWAEWHLEGEVLAAEILEAFQTETTLQQKRIAEYLRERIQRRIRTSLLLHRKQLKAFRKALGARTTTKQKEYLEGISRKTLFRTFPLWVTTIADVHDLIPMEREEFDLAIIDEATQCDMASCVPILQRAKRVVVTGDPKQLRHVSFLSRERQRNISERVTGSDGLAEELDFRSRSLLDLALEHLETDRQLVFLDEHFRSQPDLIAYSNEQFYERRLKVMRTHPAATEAGLRCERVMGKRDRRGVNRDEAKAVCTAVTELIERERGAVNPSSIGVLSPFRDQVEHLERLLSQKLGIAEIQRHALRIGTAYAFQGDERDQMFLSLGVDDDSHGTAFAYLRRADVFNVSITRARNRQVVFHSFDPRKLDADDLLRGYLEQGCAVRARNRNETWHELQSEMSEALREAGYRCEHNFEVGGINIALVVGHWDRWIGLDLICKAAGKKPLTLEQYRLIERAGFQVYPVTEREWKTRPREVLKIITRLLPPNSPALPKVLVLPTTTTLD